jgi:hypothetical protein
MGHGTAWGRSESTIAESSPFIDSDSLAYHEMRLILASILLHFDLELERGQEQWMRQESHILWDKPPLLVKLKYVSEISA